MRLHGRVLAIAGSDSGGGAGIQADIKAILALGAYAATALTAITVQDSTAVHRIHALPPDLVAAQLACALNDPGADALKTGMLADAATIAAVAAVLQRHSPIPLVLDPVMVASSGAVLLAGNSLDALRKMLLPLASLITPNAPEAALLCGFAVDSQAAQHRAAETLLAQGAAAVLIKGGHLPGQIVTDLLATAAGSWRFQHPRLDTRHTHGTGCTLAAAIAAGLAQHLNLPDAVARGLAYTRLAIEQAPGYGPGHGPLNHAVTVEPFPHRAAAAVTPAQDTAR